MISINCHDDPETPFDFIDDFYLLGYYQTSADKNDTGTFLFYFDSISLLESLCLKELAAQNKYFSYKFHSFLLG